jgi:hypothetical protein
MRLAYIYASPRARRLNRRDANPPAASRQQIGVKFLAARDPDQYQPPLAV